MVKHHKFINTFTKCIFKYIFNPIASLAFPFVKTGGDPTL
jgi:hypothetical protein